LAYPFFFPNLNNNISKFEFEKKKWKKIARKKRENRFFGGVLQKKIVIARIVDFLCECQYFYQFSAVFRPFLNVISAKNSQK
jgi:hypothetical protein